MLANVIIIPTHTSSCGGGDVPSGTLITLIVGGLIAWAAATVLLARRGEEDMPPFLCALLGLGVAFVWPLALAALPFVALARWAVKRRH